MPAPSTAEQFLDLVQKSGVLDEKRLSTHLDKLRATGGVPPEPAKLAGILVRDGLLTQFQAERFLEGRWRRFVIGKYKVLERIASGGMGSVYLCEHKFMRRRAAVKVLPEARAADPAALARFYREARAVAALDHPNIVRAYDIDQEENLHFLVMEYVDGTSLQELVRKSGPLEPARAAHYISQAAMGLQHAHEFAGLIHRDIKPGNLIVDRGGIIKILDMGLARFFNDQDDMLTQKYDENVLGTADYLAPEQALDSHSVDIRADVYSLGATFYYCLTGKTPFSDGTVAQKLIWHQTRQPKPVRSLRQDVPEGIIAVIEKMMAKEPKDRYQTPNEVVGALAPWTQAEIAPPAEGEMPQLSPAAQTQSSDFNFGPRSPTPLKPPRGKRNKSWQIAENGSNPAVPQPMPNPPLAERSNPQSPKGAEPKRTAGDPKAGAPTLVAPPDLSGAENQDFGLSVSAAPATSQQIDEESIAWENLAAADTKESVAHLDTTATPKNPPSGNRPVSHSHISAADRRRLWWVIGGVCSAALLLLALLLWLAFAGESPKTGSQEKIPASRAMLLVSQNGGPNNFRSIQAAAIIAKPGDHIVVEDAVLEEHVTLIGKNNLTIEAARGASVTWRAPTKAGSFNQILYAGSCENLVIQGFKLDGAGKVDEGLLVLGDCPGLSLKGVQISGFKAYGVLFSNCAGQPGREVTLQDVQISAAQDAEAAIAFVLNEKLSTPKVNRHIAIRDCRFEGNYKSPILLGARAALPENLIWENNTYKSKKDVTPNQLSAPK